MTIEEILKALAHKDRKFPREALEQAIAQKDEITPHLLKILESVTNNPEDVPAEDSSHLYAMFLLAQFREERAYPLIVELVSLPPVTVDKLLGDVKTEDLDSILASVCHGDTSLITRLVEDQEVDEYVRDSALGALAILVACGQKPREEVMDYYKSLFEGRLEKDYSYVWNGLVCRDTELYPEEVYEQIKKAFEENLVEEWVIDLDFVDEQIALGKEKVLARFREEAHLIEDTIAEMEWWACYKEPGGYSNGREKVATPGGWKLPGASKEKVTWIENRGAYFAPKKIGRNEPCPCGSGKKYKKCCGYNQT